ncbi:MAG: hypothetical protein WCP19_15765 [Chloroflexota bacterium]
MYFFVRFQGVITIITGVLIMILGVGAAIYGFVQNAAVVDMVNSYYLAGKNSVLTDARFYAAITGLGLFVIGLGTAASGQLMLVFADIASNTYDTKKILQRLAHKD